MIIIEGKQYYTALEFSREVEVSKTYICRLARAGKLRQIRTGLGYLFPVETVKDDWDKARKPRKVKQ